MADLVRRGAALVVVRSGPARNRLSENVASIFVVSLGAGGGVGGEVANAEQAAAEVGEEIDVQVLVGSLAECGFHLGIVVASCPVVVDGEVAADEGEVDAGRIIAAVQHGKLGHSVREESYIKG